MRRCDAPGSDVNDQQRKMARKAGKVAGYRHGGRVRYADGGMIDRWGQKSTYVPRSPEPEKKKDEPTKKRDQYREVKGIVRG